MKRILTLLAVVLFTTQLLAQFPQKMSYQAIIRNNSNSLITNTTVGLKISILQNSPDGVAIYTETKTPTTNSNGLISIEIGDTEAFGTIDWAKGPFYIKTETDPTGGTNYTISGTSQLLSVPYALYAKTAESVTESVTEMDPVYAGSNASKITETDITNLSNLSGVNTGDQDLSELATKMALTDSIASLKSSNPSFTESDPIYASSMAASITGGDITNLGNLSGVNTGDQDLSEFATKASLSSEIAKLKSETYAISAPGEKLEVSNNCEGEVMMIQNTNGNTGDGLTIKLGRTHPAWNGLIYITVNDPMRPLVEAQRQTIENLLTGGNPLDATILKDLAENIFGESFFIEATTSVYNSVAENINNALNLPFKQDFSINIPKAGMGKVPYPTGTTTTDILGVKVVTGIKTSTYSIPPSDINLPGPTLTVMPAIPTLTCNLNKYTIPKFQDVMLSNSLTEENKYISFLDKENRQLGAIEAQSLEDWTYNNFLNIDNMIQLVSTIATFDPSDDITGLIGYISEKITSYNELGVSYSSGHGDYAEWLERIDPEEQLSPGDIVGVVGGKISRSLKGAEQIMAISSKPIVIGNTPSKDRSYMGNNVAFMGQIPVKITGPVKTGDYIVGNTEIKGYGRAISPENMTLKDYSLVVGRAWESNNANGPKLINTVVGIDNGESINLLRKYKTELDETNKRLDDMEQKIDLFLKVSNNN